MPVGREISLVLQLAHALVDEAGEVRDAVGDGRIDGETTLIERAAPHAGVFALAAGAIARLGDRDEFLQDLDLGLALRIADQHLHDFLEREEPERQLHVARADNLREFAESGRVLVVRIEQHHVRRRILLQDGAQD